LEKEKEMKVTDEYHGVSYTFDPEAEAMKALGITNKTEETRMALARKTLEYQKTARRRARTGAVLRYFMNKSKKGEQVCPAAMFLALKCR
jgi:hypothetical protein